MMERQAMTAVIAAEETGHYYPQIEFSDKADHGLA